MNNLIIATTNVDRGNKLKSFLFEKYPHLKVQILSIEKNIPVESGRNELENAMIKARFYAKNSEDPVLVVDSGIYFDGVNNQDQARHAIHEQIESIKKQQQDLTKYWQDFFSLNKIQSGYIKKVFVLSTRNLHLTEEVIIPFTIFVPSEVTAVNIFNPLNHFMVPQSFTHTFDEMTDIERKEYEEKYTALVIDKLFDRYKKTLLV